MKSSNPMNIKVVVTIIFTALLFHSKAQTTNSKVTDKDGNVTVGQPAAKINKSGKGQTASATTPSSQSVYFLNEEDQYQGRTNEILNVITVDKIPSDFPKYIKGKGIEWYNDQIDIYYRLHPSILKEHYRKKLGI